MDPLAISNELLRLGERRRALETLMRYETDLVKLKFYRNELELLFAEIAKQQESLALPKKKVLPFPTRKPVRSA
jgi:hypothetical protein